MVITAIKVAVVLLVIVVGLFYIKAANYTPFIPPRRAGAQATAAGLEQPLLSLIAGGAASTFGVYGVLAGASLVFFAFIGFDVVATTAEETRNPQKDLPRGILGSLAIVTVLYVAVVARADGMVHYTELATPPDGTRAPRWPRRSRSSASTGRPRSSPSVPGRPDHRRHGAACSGRAGCSSR